MTFTPCSPYRTNVAAMSRLAATDTEKRFK